MPVIQSRVVNAHYYVIEAFNESWVEEVVTVLRTIRVLKSEDPIFFQRVALGVRKIFSLPPEPAGLQNASASYHDLIRSGVLRNVLRTGVVTPCVVYTPPMAPVEVTAFPQIEIPFTVPANSTAFCHFENAADPSFLDFFFYNPAAEPLQNPNTYDFGIYLGHSIIGGPVGGMAFSESMPPVPTEPECGGDK